MSSENVIDSVYILSLSHWLAGKELEAWREFLSDGLPGLLNLLSRGSQRASPKAQRLFQLLLFLLAKASQGQLGQVLPKGMGN